jgi:hypothetical protein
MTMNERIRELAEQLDPVATIGNWGRVEWADNVYPQLNDKMYAAIDLQKFAELIIADCELVVDCDNMYAIKEHFEEKNNGIITAVVKSSGVL